MRALVTVVCPTLRLRRCSHRSSYEYRNDSPYLEARTPLLCSRCNTTGQSSSVCLFLPGNLTDPSVSSVVAYQTTGPPTGSGKFLYILPGGLTEQYVNNLASSCTCILISVSCPKVKEGSLPTHSTEKKLSLSHKLISKSGTNWRQMMTR
jgi:hypothetical protein